MALQTTVDRIEGDKVILLFSDGQQLVVAKSVFTQKVRGGQVFFLNLQSDFKKTKAQEVMAKNLLKAILKKQGNES